jgi:hypothetical protein
MKWSPELARRVIRDMRRELFSNPVIKGVYEGAGSILSKMDLPEGVKERILGKALSALMQTDPELGVSRYELSAGMDSKQAASSFVRRWVEPYIQREIVMNPEVAATRVQKWYKPPSDSGEPSRELPKAIQVLTDLVQPFDVVSPFPGVPGAYSTQHFGGSTEAAGRWNHSVGLPLPFTWSPDSAGDPLMMDAQEAMARTTDMFLASKTKGSDIKPKDVIENFLRPIGLDEKKTLDSRMEAIRRWASDPVLGSNPLVRALATRVMPALEVQADWTQFGSQMNRVMQMMRPSDGFPSGPPQATQGGHMTSFEGSPSPFLRGLLPGKLAERYQEKRRPEDIWRGLER